MTRTLLLAVLLSLACAQRAPAPSADARQRAFPDMAGRAVFVLPVQAAVPAFALPAGAPPGTAAAPLNADARATLDAEIAYWLANGAPRVRWLLSAAVVRAVERAPTLNVHAHDLPVHDFLRARLTAIGDPLYGDLRKVGALLDTRPALLPIGAVWIQESDTAGRVHIAFALIDTTGGAVQWYGVVAGNTSARPDAAALASTAQALARMVAGS